MWRTAWLSWEWGKPRGLIPLRRNESRKVETTAVKWVISKGPNTGFQKYCTWRRVFDIDSLPMWRLRLASTANSPPPPTVLLGRLMVEFCEITHGQTKPHLVELLWTRDRPVTETSTWQHRTLTRDKHPCSRQDSNQQSQQASGRRPTI